jgi:hypothetical protein
VQHHGPTQTTDPSVPPASVSGSPASSRSPSPAGSIGSSPSSNGDTSTAATSMAPSPQGSRPGSPRPSATRTELTIPENPAVDWFLNLVEEAAVTEAETDHYGTIRQYVGTRKAYYKKKMDLPSNYVKPTPFGLLSEKERQEAIDKKFVKILVELNSMLQECPDGLYDTDIDNRFDYAPERAFGVSGWKLRTMTSQCTTNQCAEELAKGDKRIETQKEFPRVAAIKKCAYVEITPAFDAYQSAAWALATMTAATMTTNMDPQIRSCLPDTLRKMLEQAESINNQKPIVPWTIGSVVSRRDDGTPVRSAMHKSVKFPHPGVSESNYTRSERLCYEEMYREKHPNATHDEIQAALERNRWGRDFAPTLGFTGLDSRDTATRPTHTNAPSQPHTRDSGRSADFTSNRNQDTFSDPRQSSDAATSANGPPHRGPEAPSTLAPTSTRPEGWYGRLRNGMADYMSKVPITRQSQPGTSYAPSSAPPTGLAQTGIPIPCA